MRVHRPARRQRASTRTWPPGAVAWSELVIWRCSLVFRLVIAAMTLHHHTGVVVSTDSSPKDAFLLSRLTIRVVGPASAAMQAEQGAGPTGWEGDGAPSVHGYRCLGHHCPQSSGGEARGRFEHVPGRKRRPGKLNMAAGQPGEKAWWIRQNLHDEG